MKHKSQAKNDSQNIKSIYKPFRNFTATDMHFWWRNSTSFVFLVCCDAIATLALRDTKTPAGANAKGKADHIHDALAENQSIREVSPALDGDSVANGTSCTSLSKGIPQGFQTIRQEVANIGSRVQVPSASVFKR